VRRITKSEISRHHNPHFCIRIIENASSFYFEFGMDLVRRIQQTLEAGREFVGILPVGPTPQYEIASRMINELKISCRHVHTFNMDEYADEQGNSAPIDWPGSFQKAMMENFFGKIGADLRPPLSQIHFPSRENIQDYSRMIQDAGEADVCYGGIGWCGHIAFWEATWDSTLAMTWEVTSRLARGWWSCTP
jgi:glucosamine-6-phosphate deaminase